MPCFWCRQVPSFFPFSPVYSFRRIASAGFFGCLGCGGGGVGFTGLLFLGLDDLPRSTEFPSSSAASSAGHDSRFLREMLVARVDSFFLLFPGLLDLIYLGQPLLWRSQAPLSLPQALREKIQEICFSSSLRMEFIVGTSFFFLLYMMMSS